MNHNKANLISAIPNAQIAFTSILIIIVGMFASRALMSVGMMLLFANSIFNKDLVSNFKTFITKPNWWMLSFYFVLMSVSFFWSNDQVYFSQRMQIMLPFLVLPFGFYSIKEWRTSWFQTMMLLFIGLTIIGIFWSLGVYYSGKEMFDIAYGYSKVIPTPFKSDHIRFSLAVVVCICFLIQLSLEFACKWIQYIFVFLALLCVFYLHILSAKSGLLAFYLVVFALIIKLFFYPKYRLYAIVAFVSILILPTIMYFASTTFRAKISYVRYSLEQMQNKEKQINVSDEGRLISYEYAFELIKDHPVIGVGLGDVYQSMLQKFKRDIPSFNQEPLLPHNQFLMVGVGLGFIGMFYLLAMQLMLLIKSKRNEFLYFAMWLIFFMAIMVEPFYETQYGTCLYLFATLFVARKSMETDNQYKTLFFKHLTLSQ